MGTLSQALDELLQKQQKWNERKSPVWGTSTGFPSLDAFTGGFENGKVFVLGARTSHGKTALATAMAFNVATEALLNNKPGQILIFSPEMAAYMIALRQVCVMSNVSMTKIRQGSASEAELNAWYEAVEMLRLLDPYIILEAQDEPSIQDMIRRVELKCATDKDPVLLVVIDYLQYLTSNNTNGSYEVISAIAREVKALANRVKVPILLLSQLNRDAAKKDEVPDLHDLEGSGKIEARADVVALLWRPNDIQDKPGEPQTAIVAIRKNRDGPVGFASLYYFPELTKFVDPLSLKKEDEWSEAPDRKETLSSAALPALAEEPSTPDLMEMWNSDAEDTASEWNASIELDSL